MALGHTWRPRHELGTIPCRVFIQAFGDAIAGAAPLKRIGRSDDMAGVAIYLASRAGAYVTGAVTPWTAPPSAAALP